jgi:RyR domain
MQEQEQANEATVKLDYVIARVCHEANKAYCDALGDSSQKSWDEAEGWQRESAIKGVRFRLDNPNATAADQHEAWRKDKADQGWVYGEVKDAEAKTHPCMVPYEELPFFQRKKDAIFQAVVDALR